MFWKGVYCSPTNGIKDVVPFLCSYFDQYSIFKLSLVNSGEIRSTDWWKMNKLIAQKTGPDTLIMPIFPYWYNGFILKLLDGSETERR